MNFYRVLTKGGFVLLRSAAKKPWYMEKYVLRCTYTSLRHIAETFYFHSFMKAGFKVTCISVREGNKVAIDRVNMYVQSHARLTSASLLIPISLGTRRSGRRRSRAMYN